MPDDLTQDKFVEIFASRSHMATVEAEMIHLMLQSAGIKAWLVRENIRIYPVGKIAIRVLESQVDEARELIRQAQLPDDEEPSMSEG